MPDTDKNELIRSLLLLRLRYCGGVSVVMTINSRTAKDRVEFQKVIDGIKALINERDEARKEVCELLHEGFGRSPEQWAKRNGWDGLYGED